MAVALRSKGGSGMTEKEDPYGKEGQPEITEPFEPKSVDIISSTMVISNIIDRLRYKEIDLEPDFQRKKNLWSVEQQSRLIESMIVRIPLPSFYFDAAQDDMLVVVDGIQRLYSIQRFVVDKELKLTGLEYLKDFEGKGYDDLSLQIQRRIRETEITAFLIRKGTPDRVRTSIFARINTGGVPLTLAEIRNSVYRGKVAAFLRELAHSKAFTNAVNNKISPDRMEDCEFVNRFLAFYLLDQKDYKGNLDEFLVKVLDYLTTSEDSVFDEAREAFFKAMKRSYEMFEKHAFRRIYKSGQYGKINKPLFEVCSVTMAKIKDTEYCELMANRKEFIKKYDQLLLNGEFIKVITSGTAKASAVQKRYAMLGNLIQGVVKNDFVFSNREF